jgi:signal transduction histidine kinase
MQQHQRISPLNFFLSLAHNRLNTAPILVFRLLILFCLLLKPCALPAQALSSSPSLQTPSLPQRQLSEQQLIKERRLLKNLSSAHDTTRLKILDSLAWIFRGTDFGRAINYAQQAEQGVIALGSPRVRAENKNYLGIIYRNLGNYPKAMAYFVEARSIAAQQGYKREEGYALNNIGDIYKYQRKYAEADSYSLKALTIFEQLRDTAGLYYCYIRLGELAQYLKNYSKALYSFGKTVEYSKAFRDEIWEAGSRNRIGQVYREQGLYAKALESFFAAKKISERVVNDEGELSFILVQIGKTYWALKKNDSARVYLQQGLHLAENIGIKQHILDASKSLAEVALTERNFMEAFQFQTKQMAMSDSLYSEAGRREIEKLSAKYELEQQQNAIDSLNIAQKQERMIGLVLVGGVILLMVLATLLYRNVRSEHRANAEILRQQRVLEDQSAEIEIANTTLQEQNSELSALNLEKNELMAIVAHDLKNPIGAVTGLAQLIVNGTIEQDSVMEAARQIVSAGDRMLALVMNVLDSNRLESNGMGFAIVELDILPVVEATCWQYETAARTKNISIQYLPLVTSAVVFADEQAMMQVLDNIISNAVKYSPHGKSIVVRVQSSSSAVRVEVQDQGEGISEDDMKKLFGKFARLSARPTGGEHSTGLGLSIVKRMVEAMNGKVWCESELGKGATFIVELPRT